jgi:hypothetical protein
MAAKPQPIALAYLGDFETAKADIKVAHLVGLTRRSSGGC